MEKLLISILLIGLFPLHLYAQEDTTISELLSNSEVKAAEIEELDQQEEERTKEIANLLGFVLPEYTDNPSYVVTFTDPSPDKKGVEIELDGKTYVKISSPYTFPALSIGKHSVNFRFYDKDSNVQILEYEIIVLPRTPIINSPVIEETSISFDGTALSNSEVIFSISANTYNETGIVNTDENGNWSVKFTPDEGLADGIYTFMAYTRKYGYASNLSSPITFGVGGDIQDSEEEIPTKEIFFSFSSLNRDNVVKVFSDNKDLIILVSIIFVSGVILAIVFKSLIDSIFKNKKIKAVEDILAKQKKDSNREGKTLRELFESGKEEEKVTTPTKEPSIINKDMFLKKYRNIDPDTSTGKEKSSKSIKKKIKVSLTSHED